MWCNENVIKMKIMRKMGNASGGDGDKAPITDNNARRGRTRRDGG